MIWHPISEPIPKEKPILLCGRRGIIACQCLCGGHSGFSCGCICHDKKEVPKQPYQCPNCKGTSKKITYCPLVEIECQSCEKGIVWG